MEPSRDPSQSCPESHRPATPSASHGQAFFCQDPQNGGKAKCGLKLGGPAWALSPWGSPWEVWWTIVPTAIGQLCLGECRVSLLFVMTQQPSYLGTIGESAGVTCACLRWGNIIATLMLFIDTGNLLNTNGKGNREKQGKKNRELLGCFRSHL